jgi:uncharacterized protein DUF6438
MRQRTLALSCLVVVLSQLLAGQTYLLSEVEVRLTRTPHGGCFGPCVQYDIAVRGDGTVEYNGVGLVEGTRTRTIAIDEVVALVNEFLQARFFDAFDSYRNGPSTLVRAGGVVMLHGAVGGSDDPQAELTLRLGDRTKTVTLFSNYPGELGRLPELVDRIGGPQVWQPR